ncbi:tripartite tricarboxylate transporter substrate binding protein [Diaphorobacter sp. HDW4A]|uniref:Bug family tripartite tricarboxylate transporter substrate binding protein n=1 Tax=Diaphorobacter sp. HDW4A TaxID=2714924 RepID=UPI001409684E|nr:tripartite tricarboxylate transporter substrate binding protein [Diaphorobacter sp. HDW4A]QIL82625.1 tripartite tricarboxylate transporter substrate binding protein [Diaphorobacter sp. HDW4A]
MKQSIRLAITQRRALLATAATMLAITSTWGTAAHADGWPTKPVRIIVPAAPGGSSDPLARLVADELTRTLGQSFIVENRPGANGNVGSASVVKSQADGYTLLFSWTGTLVPAITLYNAKAYHPQNDLMPIVMIASVPNIIIAQPSLGVKTMPELAQYAKAHPGELNFGTTGSGSSYHLSGELFKKTQNVSMTHVPYTSPGAVLTDLVGGRLQVAFPGVTAAAPFVKDGRLTGIAVMAEKRSDLLPNVPTTVEAGYPALLSETWFGLLAPKNAPAEVREKINANLNAALKTAAFRDKLVGMGYTTLGGTSDHFEKVIAADIQKWGEVVKFSGAKVD